MLPAWRILAPLGLLVQGIRGWEDAAQYTTTCITVFDTTTVQVTHYVDVTISNTKTDVIVVYVTEYTTTTLHYTVSVTETDSATVTTTETDSATVTNTETDSATITNTKTDSVTTTNTETDSVTITDTATTTVFSTTFDPCPKSCSISVETVNLFFWPTDRPYSYPSTYVDPSLDYTFTSPSVYMLIPTAQGINTLGQPEGPSMTDWMLPLNLYEVSTIAQGGNITRQLTLSDLGTDCPQTADPTAIATMVDSRCDPLLAAPRQVSSWAYPCNACGRFGLFDPPYAIPTVTGPLVVPTITPPAVTVTVVSIPPPTFSPLTTAMSTSLSSITQQTTTAVATASATRDGPVGSLGMWSVLIAMIALY